MEEPSWSNSDQARLLQRISLLKLVNEIPEQPADNIELDEDVSSDSTQARVLSLRREKELVAWFACLAASTDNPRKVVAVCIEESAGHNSLTIRLAVNHGGLDTVKSGFSRMARILESVAQNKVNPRRSEDEFLLEVVCLNQNRILTRLRSRHAIFHCNFKKHKKRRPKLLISLAEIVKGVGRAIKPNMSPFALETIDAIVILLKTKFESLESMKTEEARSAPGSELLLGLVNTCEELYSQKAFHLIMDKVKCPDKGWTNALVAGINKIGRYKTISNHLVRAAGRYKVFQKVEITDVKLRALATENVETDSFTSTFIDWLLESERWRRYFSRLGHDTASKVKEWVSQNTSADIPVHAEIQLLFYYELKKAAVPPRIICASKKACFLCNLFVKLHGTFTLPSTHGRIYEKWTLPEAFKDFRQAPLNQFLMTMKRFNQEIERTLWRELDSTRRPYPAPYESVVFGSVVWSQSSRSTQPLTSAIQPAICSNAIVELGSSTAKSNSTITPLACPSYQEIQSTYSSTFSETSKKNLTGGQSFMNSLQMNSSASFPDSTLESIRLEEGKSISRLLSSNAQQFKACTSKISLTFDFDSGLLDKTSILSAGQGNEQRVSVDEYWVTVEWLSNVHVFDERLQAVVDVCQLGTTERLIDLGVEKPQKPLCLYAKGDLILVKYNFSKDDDAQVI